MIFLILFVAQAFPVERAVIGHSHEQRPLVVETWGSGQHHYLFIASIHGNESQGTPLLLQLQWFLKENPRLLEGKKVSFLLVANPDGWVVGRRENGKHVDINRNFLTHNFGRGAYHGKRPLSEPESDAMDRYLRENLPERTLVFHEPMNCIDFDGPTKELALHLSEVGDIRIKRLGSRSGSIGTFIGTELKKEVITLELPASKGQDSAEQWERYGSTLLAFLDIESCTQCEAAPAQ